MKRLLLLLSLFVSVLVLVSASVSAIEPVDVTVGQAKTLPEWTVVRLTGSVVTAGQEAAPGSVFVEAPDRSSGIRVITDELLYVGQSVDVTGCVRRINGEWQIAGAEITAIREGTPLAPLWFTTKTLASDPSETLNYTGINTTGLLVKITGRVTGIPADERVVYIDDGCGLQDGIGGYAGLRVQVPPYAVIPAVDETVSMTGIHRVSRFTLASEAEVNGQTYAAGTAVYVPFLWASSSNFSSAGILGPMEVIWDPYAYPPQNVMEYQILRDIIYGSTLPVLTIRDPAAIAAGRVNLAQINGYSGSRTVNYYQLNSSPSSSYTDCSYSLPLEDYGTTHTYQVRAVCRVTTGGVTQYAYTPLGNPIVVTAIEKVDPYQLYIPRYNEEVYFFNSDFRWAGKAGASSYRVVIEPVSNVPGREPAPSWTYTFNSLYPVETVALSTDGKTSLLATYFPTANPNKYAGATLRWRVDCRNGKDTSEEWVKGDYSLFRIGAAPPPPP